VAAVDFTWLDYAIVLVLGASLLQGLRRGLIAAIVSVVGFVAAMLLAGRFWPVAMPVARHFVTPVWAAELAGFFLVALLTILGFTLVGGLLRRTVQQAGMGWLDRLCGGAFGLLRGTLVIVLGFIIVAAFAPNVLFVQRSRLAPVFLSAARALTPDTSAAASVRVRQGLGQMQHGR